MVLYTCKICFKNFKQKGHFIDHTEHRKKPCQPIINDILLSPPTIFKLNEKNIKNAPEKIELNIYKLTNIEQEIKIFQCEMCQSVFTPLEI